jgi:hypothetical protein
MAYKIERNKYAVVIPATGFQQMHSVGIDVN